MDMVETGMDLMEKWSEECVILKANCNSLKESIVSNKIEVDKTLVYGDHLLQASAWLQLLVTEINSENLAKVQYLVNQALLTVFFDQDLKFEFRTAIKRNQTIYSVCLIQDGIEGNLNSFGGGIWVIVAVVLKLVFNRLLNRYPIAIFDESLSFLADKYIPNAAYFLKEFSQDNLTLPILY